MLRSHGPRLFEVSDYRMGIFATYAFEVSNRHGTLPPKMLNDVSKENDKTVDEQKDPEKNDSHTINRIELDSGEERCRYRKKWWQLW